MRKAVCYKNRMGKNVLPVGKFSAWLGRVLELTFTSFSLGEHSITINERNGYVPFLSHINHTEKNPSKTLHAFKAFDAADNY